MYSFFVIVSILVFLQKCNWFFLLILWMALCFRSHFYIGRSFFSFVLSHIAQAEVVVAGNQGRVLRHSAPYLRPIFEIIRFHSTPLLVYFSERKNENNLLPPQRPLVGIESKTVAFIVQTFCRCRDDLILT